MAVEYVMKPNTLDMTEESYRVQVVNSESFGVVECGCRYYVCEELEAVLMMCFVQVMYVIW
jgi:ferredoxin-thioredoxin reductase catalytic subunit